ncbi:MAG: YceI family protein [Candidatus Pacebacteria bacterium]|nr:YceI family protein [Candidatus Paceibacterota bacterium]
MKYILIVIVLVIGAYFLLPDKKIEAPTNNIEGVDIVGEYKVEEDSRIDWRGAKVVGLSHDGSILISSGEINNGTGEIVFDVTSITSDSAGLSKHLKSEDFFDVETYPMAKFYIKSIDAKSITGDLTIKDVTKEITVPVEVSIDGDMAIKGETVIDRTDFGINYDSGSIFKELGDKAIDDDVNIYFDLKFAKSK